MASIKDLKKRIGTVKNTQQTTKAMKMVSTAKLRRAQEAVRAHRPYAKEIQSLIELASSAESAAAVKSPLLRRAGESVEGQSSVLLVVVTSDRGLCGGFNGNVIRAAQRWLEVNRANYDRVELGCVGKRGYDFFRGRGRTIGFHFPEFGGKVTYSIAKKVAGELIKLFESGKYTEVHFVYNEFKNAGIQTPVSERFLPVEGKTQDGSATSGQVEMIKPSATEVLELLLRKNFAAQAYRVLLESQAGEHGARMTAMSNATDNAGDMIRMLTLEYNKQRQAGITKELLEIISGSESQKSA